MSTNISIISAAPITGAFFPQSEPYSAETLDSFPFIMRPIPASLATFNLYFEEPQIGLDEDMESMEDEFDEIPLIEWDYPQQEIGMC